MKSQHRHELETNVLAHRVAVVLDRVRPYNSIIVGIVVAIVAAVLGFSYFSAATAARQSEAWNTYNQAVEGPIPNLEELHQSAEEFPDSPMQQWADVTWADGQVWMASRAYIQNRAAAMEALNRATSTYQGLLQESEDERLEDRAHFGLARVHELRGELDKAREEYLAVRGGFAELAKRRAAELAEKDAKDTYAWLATAEGPRRAISGPGTPGQRPDFAPGDLDMPAGETPGEAGEAPSVDDLFKGLGLPEDTEDAADRYETPDAKSSDSDENADDASQPKE